MTKELQGKALSISPGPLSQMRPVINHAFLARDLLDMLSSLVSLVEWPHLGQGKASPFAYFTPFLLTCSSQKQILQRRQEYCPSLLQDPPNGENSAIIK